MAGTWTKCGAVVRMVRAIGASWRSADMQMIDSTHVKAHRSASGGKGGAEAGCWPLARKAQHEDPRTRRSKGRLIAILLTGGEAHDCSVAERLFRRVRPAKRLLGNKAYDRRIARRPG
jgi:hypothetical protein